MADQTLQSVVIALDWTPNTNHSGFYVARSKGFYKEAGLDVTLLSPHVDQYKVTPASRVAEGSAHFACVPSESIISYHTWPDGTKPKLVAVAALLQDPQQSAIVTLKSSGIDRPAQLDGKRYASYAARFESRIVQAMIRADGGAGNFEELVPPMLGIWNTLLSGSSDATWVFMPWEGVAAERAGLSLNAFKLGDYGIPYCYSPVLAAHPDTLDKHPDMVRRLLSATAKGYEHAAAHPAEAAHLLCAEVAHEESSGRAPMPEPLDPDMVAASQQIISQCYLEASSSKWGRFMLCCKQPPCLLHPELYKALDGTLDCCRMDMLVWDKFLDWLSAEGLLTTKAQSRDAAASADSSFASLDGMRQGDVGETIPRDSIVTAALATNSFLP